MVRVKRVDYFHRVVCCLFSGPAGCRWIAADPKLQTTHVKAGLDLIERSGDQNPMRSVGPGRSSQLGR